MSGTSLDGVDAALVEISGENDETKVELIHFTTLPIPEKIEKKIRDSFSLEKSNSALISSLNVELAELFVDAAIKVTEVTEEDIEISDVTFIASHGQTIYHIPDKTEDYVASTLQIGESSVIAEKTGCHVVSDFRPRDMAVGGQGAPIVPYSEYILYRDSKRTRLLQNIGGIGNVTVIPPNASQNELIAFDTGPRNMIMNELVHYFYDESYDKDGQYAAKGQVNEELLAEWMDLAYITKEPSKTTGREYFGEAFAKKYLAKYKLTEEDWLATATMFTAKSIAESVKPYLTDQTDLIIGGGGSYNTTLLKMLRELLPEVQILTQENLGCSSEAKEAIAMTILGNQTLHHQPSNVPSATGAEKEVILGKITFGIFHN